MTSYLNHETYTCSSLSLSQLKNHRQREKLEAAIHSKTDYPFDYFFEQTTSHLRDEDEEEEGEQQTVSNSGTTTVSSSVAQGGGQAEGTLGEGEGLADSTSSSDED